MRRLLFFPGHRIIAYEWERGAFRRAEAFEPDEAGREAFRGWLAEAPRTPVQLLLDVIEEEFHVDRVPHVIGRDRADLFRRTAQKHFRSTEFRYITTQGRETGGRRDDRVLIAGLTNPEILRTWLALVDEVGVPLKGIHSLPLVGERLLPHLGAAGTPRALVVSQQVPSTLRQSYYERGRLRFSRLVPGRYDDTGGFRDFLQRELDQTLHFLETQRFRRREDPLEVFVIASREVYEALRAGLGSAARVTLHLVPLERLAQRVGVKGELPGPYADTLFGQVLLRQRRPANHYGLPRLRRAFFMQRARQGLWASAALLVLAAAVAAGAAWVQGRAYERGVAEAQSRQARFERLYQQRLRQLDTFEYRATDVKSAVDLLSRLATGLPGHPGPTMAAIGRVLGGHPRIVLARLRWQASAEPATSLGEDDGAGAAPGSGLEMALDDAPAQHHALLAGDVVDFAGDYRRAVELFEAFVAGLRADPGFADVEVMEAPFDLDPDSGVSGDSGTTAGNGAGERASFKVRVRREAGDGEA